MTLIVGIRCSDGVVMASDSAATMGAGLLATIGQQHVTKVRKLGGAMLFGSSGPVGMSQLICEALESHWSDFKAQRTPEGAMRSVAIAIVDQIKPFMESVKLMRPFGYDIGNCLCRSLVAMPVKGQGCLFSFDYNGQPEQATKELPFVAIGSGQLIADPFLAFIKRLLWANKEPTLAEGRFAAVWTIEHVKRTNPGGVEGTTQLGVLTSAVGEGKASADVFGEDHVQEHCQQITSVEEAFTRQVRSASITPAEPAPTAPPNGSVGVEPRPAANGGSAGQT